MNVFDQEGFDIVFDWGETGLIRLAPGADALVLVDVMCFTSAVSVAVSRGCRVFPWRWKDDRARDFARERDALLAGPRNRSPWSLSPASLLDLPPGSRLVLPSPNGSTLTLAAGDGPVFAGCLRNAKATARAASAVGRRIAVIACGERWQHDRTLRPAYEDLVGAGAVLARLPGPRSPEAEAAVAVYQAHRSRLPALLKDCASGRELAALGSPEDIPLIADEDADEAAARLVDGAYTAVRTK